MDIFFSPTHNHSTSHLYKGIAHLRCPCAFAALSANGFSVEYVYDKLENISEVWYNDDGTSQQLSAIRSVIEDATTTARRGSIISTADTMIL